MGNGVDIRFLDIMFSLAAITQDAAGDQVKPAIVPLHDGVECRGVRAIAARPRIPRDSPILTAKKARQSPKNRQSAKPLNGVPQIGGRALER